MRFTAQWFLYGLLLIPAVLVFLRLTAHFQNRRISAFAEPDLFRRLTPGVSQFGRKLRWVLIILALSLLIIALAGPQIGTHSVMVKREGVDIILAVDTSNSMLAEDNNRPPNRLTRAKYEIASLIDDKLKGDRIGIVAFAGDAFVQCPLTVDYSAAKLFLDIMSTNLIPVQGTNFERAIEVASKAYKGEGKQQKVLIIITDGENHEGEPVEAANLAAENGIIIYAIGIGSPDGEPIPMRDSNGLFLGYKKDPDGSVVVSKLDETILREISKAAGGKYYHASPGGNELDLIYRDISGMEKKEYEGKLMTVYEERFQWPLVAGIILLAFEALVPERKKKYAIW
ncbi:MAG: hypothetical protein CO189_04365 [candidate division Zixibacteria bacterium CG_4_9_14_3_um_filter_46_8]|nr:MAG: hypothetical protein CO189_04365 [candidate division Zixibacteria bacterium CG_4_9_14_3_um_filter_46_8]